MRRHCVRGRPPSPLVTARWLAAGFLFLVCAFPWHRVVGWAIEGLRLEAQLDAAWERRYLVPADGQAGYVVPCQDPASFAERVLRILGAPYLRRRVGEAARRAAESFTRAKCARRYKAIPQEVLEQAARGPVPRPK